MMRDTQVAGKYIPEDDLIFFFSFNFFGFCVEKKRKDQKKKINLGGDYPSRLRFKRTLFFYYPWCLVFGVWCWLLNIPNSTV